MKARGSLVALVLISACGGKPNPSGPGGQLGSASPLADQVLQQSKDLPEGLDLRLSQGKAGPPALDPSKLAPAKKLSEGDAQALLARTKPIAKDAQDQQAFALRPGSTPAPRTGKTITGQFPPPPSSLLPPPASDAGKDLTVLRYMPEVPSREEADPTALDLPASPLAQPRPITDRPSISH